MSSAGPSTEKLESSPASGAGTPAPVVTAMPIDTALVDMIAARVAAQLGERTGRGGDRSRAVPGARSAEDPTVRETAQERTRETRGKNGQ